MPLALTLLPQYELNANYAQDVLRLEEDEDLFEKIIEMEQSHGRQIAAPFESHMGSGSVIGPSVYGPTKKSFYGDLIKEVTALDLKLIMRPHRAANWRNNAAIAYVMQMPNELTIWLYWH